MRMESGVKMAKKSNKKQTVMELEKIYTNEARVSCDGGGGALGHPLVYLKMGTDGQVGCPYCDKLYIQTGGESDKR